jgi:hypothetical protein
VVVDRVNPAWVTGDAAAALDSTTGLFRLMLPSGRHLAIATADTLAAAVVRFFADPNLVGNGRQSLVDDRGAPIDFDHLHLCRRLTYSESPIGELPAAAPGWTRRANASAWAMPFCGTDETAQLSIGIPDAPTDLTVVDGHLVFRAIGGGANFLSAGIPTRYPSGLPLPPETAVKSVFERTAARTIAVPTAYNQPVSDLLQMPLCASWRLHLERAVAVYNRVARDTQFVADLFVGHAAACYADSVAFFIPAPIQPTTFVVRFSKDTTGASGPFSALDSVAAPLVGPTRFERVDVLARSALP